MFEFYLNSMSWFIAGIVVLIYGFRALASARKTANKDVSRYFASAGFLAGIGLTLYGLAPLLGFSAEVLKITGSVSFVVVDIALLINLQVALNRFTERKEKIIINIMMSILLLVTGYIVANTLMIERDGVLLNYVLMPFAGIMRSGLLLLSLLPVGFMFLAIARHRENGKQKTRATVMASTYLVITFSAFLNYMIGQNRDTIVSSIVILAMIMLFGAVVLFGANPPHKSVQE